MPETPDRDIRGEISRLLMKAQAFFSRVCNISLDPELYPPRDDQPKVGQIMEEEIRGGASLDPSFVQRHLHPVVERARQNKIEEMANGRSKVALSPSNVMVRQFLLNLKEGDYQGWKTNNVAVPEVSPLSSRDPSDNIRVSRDPDVYNPGGTLFGQTEDDAPQRPSATSRIRSGFSDARKYARGRVVNTLEDANSRWNNSNAPAVGLILVLIGLVMGLGAYFYTAAPSPVFCGALAIAILLISFGLAMVTHRNWVGSAAGITLVVLALIYAFPGYFSIPFTRSRSVASVTDTPRAPGQAVPSPPANKQPAAAEVEADKGLVGLTPDQYKVMLSQAKAMEEQAKAITALANQLAAKSATSSSPQTKKRAAPKNTKPTGGNLPSAPDGSVTMLESNRKGKQTFSVCVDPKNSGCVPVR